MGLVFVELLLPTRLCTRKFPLQDFTLGATILLVGFYHLFCQMEKQKLQITQLVFSERFSNVNKVIHLVSGWTRILMQV